LRATLSLCRSLSFNKVGGHMSVNVLGLVAQGPSWIVYLVDAVVL
jgi:hypothetical protein